MSRFLRSAVVAVALGSLSFAAVAADASAKHEHKHAVHHAKMKAHHAAKTEKKSADDSMNTTAK